MSVKLSLVIPVYNAELFIFDTLTRIQKWKQTINYKVEVIFVNDGSIR
ncbi:hypothetical protein GCM10022291_23100 [Postechiella marina]|uniref:Glycosyltransferase 2-like domain-containing protein n=1 Tax=Postechiella marina TaxID=943941 RepID=A0ABP8CBM2_9FLAO